MLEDAMLSSQLLSTIEHVLSDEARLNAMRAAARSLARPDPAQAIAHALRAAQAVAGAGA
jgi:UDP-N-acetylglucosamine:LPS N-acetylglucosamine transferase